MSEALFPLAMKSTIDKTIVDIAKLHGYGYFDLDGVYMSADKAESVESAIVWSLLNFTPNPRDPFYHLQFEAGARTANDEAQYESMFIASIIQNLFSVGSGFYIQEYSKPTANPINLGEIIIASAGIAPAEFDQVSGIRPIQVVASVQRFP